MSKEFIQIKSLTTSNKNLTVKDNAVFQITLQVNLESPSDLTFQVFYIGDPNSDVSDQCLAEDIVGPLQTGTFKFDLECSNIDINSIPLHSLFGVTSILIKGAYQDKQFLRAGFFVNVNYPALPNKFLEYVENLDEEQEDEGFEEGEEPTQEENDENEDASSLVYESSSDNTRSDEAYESDELENDQQDNIENHTEFDDTNTNETTKLDNKGEIKEEIQIKEGIDENKSVIEKEKNDKVADTMKQGPQENLSDDSAYSSDENSEIHSDEKILEEEKKVFLENPDFNLKDLPQENKIEINGFILDKNLVGFELCEPPLITLFDIFEIDDIEEDEDPLEMEQEVQVNEN